MPDSTISPVMYSFRYGLKISGTQFFKIQNLTAVHRIVESNQSSVSSTLSCTPCRSVRSSDAASRRRILLQCFETSDMKPRSSASVHRNQLSTRAASGSDSPESGMGPGPGPGPRRVPPDCEKSEEPVPQRVEPSDGSSSKCLEKGYGKPLKPPRRSFLNFCKRVVRVKEKPSNCPPCPPREKEESFWDYLFKFDEKPIPEPSTCRIAHRHREACRKTDPRLCDPRYRRTEGDVLIFTEPSRHSRCTSNEPQPRPPPAYVPPKAVECRRLVEAASSSFPTFVEVKNRNEVKEVETRCSGPRRFRVPFEECRPMRRTRESFSCQKGVCGSGVAPPMSTDRGTCGGRSVAEILAAKTISQTESSSSLQKVVRSKCEASSGPIGNYSRLQRLQQLTKAADCGKDQISKTMSNPSSR